MKKRLNYFLIKIPKNILLSENDPDECVGSAVLPIEKLLPPNEKPKIISDQIAVAINNKLIGQLKIKFWLENKGPIKQQIILPPKLGSSDEQKYLHVLKF